MLELWQRCKDAWPLCIVLRMGLLAVAVLFVAGNRHLRSVRGATGTGICRGGGQRDIPAL